MGRDRIQQAAGGGKETVTKPPTATDSDGILKPLTNFQIETLSRQQVLDYQEKREQQIQAKKEREAGARDFETYKQAFVDAGGRSSQAEAAWQAHKDEMAAAQALSDDQIAAARTKRRSRSVL